MKKYVLSTLFFTLLLMGCVGTDTTESIETTSETPGTLQFQARSPLYQALATFRDWKFSKLRIPNEKDLEGMEAQVVVDMRSVYEKTIRLTKDLESEKIFHVEKYPSSTAAVSNVKQKSDGDYTADVTIKIRDIEHTYPATFEVVDKKPWRIKGSIEVPREDYRLGEAWPNVRNEVYVKFDTKLQAASQN